MSYSVIVVSTPLNDQTLSGVEAGGSLMRQYIIHITYNENYNIIFLFHYFKREKNQ